MDCETWLYYMLTTHHCDKEWLFSLSMQILMSVLWVLTTVQGMLLVPIQLAVTCVHAMRDTLVMDLYVKVNIMVFEFTLHTQLRGILCLIANESNNNSKKVHV